MILTQAQAEKKWCPLVRAAGEGGKLQTNRGTWLHDTGGDACLGEGCMAWRPVGDGSSGYCGMAGAPITVMTGLQTASVAALMDASEKSAVEARKRFEQMVGAASASGPGS